MFCLLTVIWLLQSVLATTAYAQCKFIATNPKGDTEVFVFSSLSTKTPWEVSDASHSKSKIGVIFLSICRPLETLLPSQCPDKSASSCLARRENDKWKSVISNAGSSKRTPTLSYIGGQLVFSLEGDQICKDGKNYSTNIYFSCNPQTIGEPYFMGLGNECTIQLGWVSSAACRVTPDHDTCLLPVSGGRPIDLTHLASPTFYTVRDPIGRVFELNICSEIREGTCIQSAIGCLVNSTRVIGKTSDETQLSYVFHGLRLTYLEGGASTTITFICNLTAPVKPEPLFISESNGNFSFRVETPFACLAAPIDCVAYDSEGTKYDLNPLRRRTDLWTVRDERKGKSHILYHLNICGPLPQSLPSDCLAGNIGACMTNSKPDSPSFSLGLVENAPKVTKEGTVLLEYKGGSPCKQSKFRRRVSIALECSQRDQGPQLEAVHDDCAYAFLWRTPAACPLMPAQGDNCTVMEYNLGYTFNLKGLYNYQSDYILQGDNEDSFRVNLCGSLHTPCAKQDYVSVCLKKGGKEIAIGRRDDHLLYQDGRLSFKLTGDECLPNINSSVTIILSCEHEDPDSVLPTPQMFPSGHNDCQFFMVWSHPNACPPYLEIPCSVKDDDGMLYDLSDLAWRSANHEARTSNGKRSGLILNVCRSVVFGRDSPCESSAGACIHEGDKFINAGDVKDGPYIEGGQLKLKYEQGAVCKLPEGPDHMSTIITFMCVHDAVDTEPLYLGEELCVHNVLWLTSYACAQSNDDDSITDSCSVTNPVTQYRYDLSPLQNKEFFTVDENGNEYSFTVCSSFKNSKCGSGIGACKILPGGIENTGLVNGNLRFHPGGSLSLNYTDGASCGTGKRATLIQFMCGVEGSMEGPRVIDVLGDCLVIVHWHTELACERRMKCIINAVDSVIDLSQLIRVTQNYKTSAPDGREFFINVCRPVVSVPGLSCPAGSAACVARRKNNTYIEELSLGYPIIKPVSTAHQEAGLMYIHGSSCPEVPGINISTIIRFKCDPRAGQGNPFFTSETHDCTYQFDWSTSLVCGEREQKTGPCSVYSEQLNRNIDLEPLQKPGGYHTKSKGNRRYSLNLCGDKTVCQGAAVCQNTNSGWVSHGTLQRALYDYQNDYLKLQYFGGISCNSKNDSYGAEVWLRCDEAAGTGGPRVITELVCFVIFEWRTNAICKSRNTTSSRNSSAAPPPNNTIAPSTPTTSIAAEVQDSASSTGTIVATILGVILTIALLVLIVMFVLRRGNSCHPSWRLTRWLYSPTHSQVHYSRVASADEASHLLSSQPELEWDSDEELLKV